MRNLRQVGLDIGNGMTKARSSTKETCFPSIIAKARMIGFSTGYSHGADGIVLSTDENPFFVGDLAARQGDFMSQKLGRDRLGDPFYKVLFLAALTEVLGQSCDVQAVCGLPIAWLPDKELVKAQLLDEHAVERDGVRLTYNVIQMRVVPEPFGTLLYLLLGNHGQMVKPELTGQTVGVIDIGTKTTDLALFGEGLEYRENLCDSLEVGLANIQSMLAAYVAKKWGRELTLYEADRALQTLHIKIRGLGYNLTEVVADLAARAGEVVVSKIEQLWGQALQVDHIYLSGGGASHLVDHIAAKYPHVTLVPDPMNANAIGFYRWALSGNTWA